MYSIDQFMTASVAKQVNATSTRSQFLAGLAVDQTTGRVAVSWYDCRNDSISPNKLTQFWAAVSTDGFATAQPQNFQLNPNQSDGTANSNMCGADLCCDGSGLLNYGDYTGLAFRGGYFFPVWCSYGTATDRCGDVPACRVAW